MSIATDSATELRLDAAVPESGVTFWVVPHTHWDREWYLSLEDFRWLLGRRVDGVLERLRTDPAFRFTLDGQAVVLEDYLELRPHAAEELRRRIAEGRLTVGPWYTLPDEFLVGQESLVRNLLLGRSTCTRMGVTPSPVGYLPDTFGHVSQLPQLLRGFGLDNFVFSRGLGNEGRSLGALFRWEAPDGSAVYAIPQLNGYYNANKLGHWPEYVDDSDPAGQERERNAWRLVEALYTSERYGPAIERTGLTDILLSNGVDHDPAQADLAEVLAGMEALRPGNRLVLATYEDYVGVLRDAYRLDALPAFRGELCGGLWWNVLRGVNSARMYLKQRNEQVERELQSAETLCALAQLHDPTFRYPADELRLAWRELLRNHPHDSICGCSVDEVHQDMAQRFTSARQIAWRAQRTATAALGDAPETWEYHPFDGLVRRPDLAPAAPAVYNVLAHARTRVVELLVPEALELGDQSQVHARVDGGEPRRLEVVERDGYHWVSVAVQVPPLGSAAVRLQRAEEAAPVVLPPGAARAVDDRTIENDRYRVHVAADGSLVVTDLWRGVEVPGCGLLETIGDRGDEYTFCPVAGDEPSIAFLGTDGVRVVAAGPEVATLELHATLDLPARLTDDRTGRSSERVQLPLRTRVSLGAGVPRVDLVTDLDNTACDHRLRVRFPAPGAGAMVPVRSEGHYCVNRRPAVPDASPDWHEPPHHTHHTLGGVSWGDAAIYTRGLPEYEAVVASGEIAVTLLRCVGWLSRDDIATRDGGAGPQVRAPGAQCPGRHRFEYAFALDGHLTDAALVNAAQDMRFDLVTGPGGAPHGSLLELDGDGYSLAAVKGAEDGVGVVVRVYNPSPGADAQLSVRGRIGSVVPARLDETIASPTDRVADELAPGEIRTLRLLP